MAQVLVTKRDQYDMIHLVHPFPDPELDAPIRGYRVDCRGDLVVKDAEIVEFFKIQGREDMCDRCLSVPGVGRLKQGKEPFGYRIEDFKNVDLDLEERYS